MSVVARAAGATPSCGAGGGAAGPTGPGTGASARGPRRRRAALRLLAAVAATTAVLTLVGRGSQGQPPPAYHHYVALGDSFTAAPFVPPMDVARGCYRSASNYPSILAADLHIEDVVDRACTGASTSDMTRRQVTVRGMSVPPQLRALTLRTDLVTVGLGYNDRHLYARMNTVCRRARVVCPLYDERAALEATVSRVGSDLEQTLRAVRERAPAARVLLVGYPRLLPSRGSCPELPRFRPEDRATYRYLNVRLRGEMMRAARAAGVEFVDYYRYSVGHDICARQPWVQGRVGSRYRGAALHPLAPGQRAVARLIEATLRRPPPAA